MSDESDECVECDESDGVYVAKWMLTKKERRGETKSRNEYANVCMNKQIGEKREVFKNSKK